MNSQSSPGAEVSALSGAPQDFEAARRHMVNGQVTPSGVIDPLLIGVLRRLPREAFLPEALRVRAYADVPLPLGGGRVLLAPMVLARMIELMLPQPGERALVLASGVGYGAAVLAGMDLDVTAVEAEPALLALARQGLAAARLHRPPALRQGDPTLGWPEGAPFRIILIEGCVARIPEAVLRQLGEGGRLAAIRQGPGGLGRAVVLRQAGGATGERWAFETMAPPIPDFALPETFAF